MLFVIQFYFERNELRVAPALLCPRIAAVIGQEMAQHRQQEGTEFAFGSIHRAQVILLQHALEKGLREILCIMSHPATAPQKDVNWIPIAAAELLQRCVRLL